MNFDRIDLQLRLRCLDPFTKQREQCSTLVSDTLSMSQRRRTAAHSGTSMTNTAAEQKPFVIAVGLSDGQRKHCRLTPTCVRHYMNKNSIVWTINFTAPWALLVIKTCFVISFFYLSLLQGRSRVYDMRRCPKGTLTWQWCVCYYEGRWDAGTQSWGTINLFPRRCTTLQKINEGGVEINKEKQKESCGRLHNKKARNMQVMIPVPWHLICSARARQVLAPLGGLGHVHLLLDQIIIPPPCACRMNHSQHRQTRKREAG